MSLLSASSGSAGLATSGLALDSRALESLRQSSELDPEAKVREAAGQFEALFMQQLLKSMRAAIPKSGMFDGPGSDTYTGMLDSQLAQAMAGRAGGLADVIAKQMTRHMEGLKSAAATNPADAGRAAGQPLPRMGPLAMGHPPATAPVAGAPAAAGAAPAAAYGRNQLKDAQSLQESLAKRLSPSQAQFVESMWPHAMAAEEQTGVPAAYVVGQAALESGWGKRDIRDADGNPSHNLFGIKATGGWKGKTVAVLTTEYAEGKPRKVVEEFRKYDSFADAFTDWSRLMTRSSRYADVLKAGNASEFARRLENAGYATDPAYSEKLERTINQTLNLKRLEM